MARDKGRFLGRSIGFSARGTNMLFEDNVVFNGDDCLAVVSPSRDIHFRNSYCNGGHGLSIGSLGKDGEVADVQNILYVIQQCIGGIGVADVMLEGPKTLSW
jgi:polygalacturonase